MSDLKSNCRWTCHGTSRTNGMPRRGMTLLEVMLTLALTCMLLVAISMAIDLHLRMVDARRDDVERIQVARAVLNIIARDLQCAVEPCQTDFSALVSMAGKTNSGGSTSETAPETADTAGEDPTGGTEETGLDDAIVEAPADESATVAAGTIAGSSEPPPRPGLYGNQYELQVDVSRVPRVEEMRQVAASSLEPGLRDIPSEVKTVAYYLHDPESGLVTGDFRDAAGNPQRGLVRRSLDRAVTLHAANSASVTSLEQTGELIAPEIVAIEFQYFSGCEWVYEWDSDANGGLPVAVRITISLIPDGQDASLESGAFPNTSSVGSPASADLATAADLTYSLVVRLPTARPCEGTGTTDMTGSETTEAYSP